jgi:HK97 family phage prohead protease
MKGPVFLCPTHEGPDMLRKVLEHAQLKVSAEGTGQLRGYASTFANWDRVNERPVKGAFTASLPTFLKDGFIAYSHQWGSPPVATVNEAYEDEHGLFFSADFHSTSFAQDVRTTVTERIERGKSVMTSIGYEPPDTEQVDAPELPGGYGLLLKRIPLLEISVVPVPANPAALVTEAKDATSLLAGLTLGDSHDLALAAVRGYAERMDDLRTLRAKEGRVLSGANREKLSTLRGSLADVLSIIEQLLTESTPAPKGAAPNPYLDELLRFAVQEARLHGVTL